LAWGSQGSVCKWGRGVRCFQVPRASAYSWVWWVVGGGLTVCFRRSLPHLAAQYRKQFSSINPLNQSLSGQGLHYQTRLLVVNQSFRPARPARRLLDHQSLSKQVTIGHLPTLKLKASRVKFSVSSSQEEIDGSQSRSI